MPPVSVTYTFVSNTPAVAAQVNQNFDDIVAWLNGGNFPIANLEPGSAGQLLVAGGGGVPAYKTISGDAKVNSGGVLTLEPDSVSATQIEDGQVGADELAEDAVTADALAPDAVEAEAIKDGAVTGAKQGTVIGVRVRSTNATQPIANGASPETIIWNVEDWDTDDMWTSGDKVKIKTAGVYSIAAYLQWEQESTGHRRIRITVNNVAIAALRQVAAIRTDQSLSALYKLEVDDEVRVDVVQVSDSGAKTVDATSTSPSLTLVRLGAG